MYSEELQTGKMSRFRVNFAIEDSTTFHERILHISVKLASSIIIHLKHIWHQVLVIKQSVSIIVYRAFFVNNISGYTKFPMTCFFRYLPKNLAIFYPKFFPVICFKYNSKNFPFSS